jgi:hypothetical protein
MKASSLSTFGFLLFSVLIPIVGGILGLAYYHFHEKQEWGTASRSALIPLFLSLIAVWIVVTGAYFYRVSQIVYNDHQYFVGRVQQLKQEQNGLVNPKNLIDQIANLKKQIGILSSTGMKVFPVVRNNQRQGIPMMEYILTTGKIRTPADVVATCDFPISDGLVNPLTATGGSAFTSDNRRISENQYRFMMLSPDWSPATPLLITVYFQPGTVTRMPSCKFSIQ